MRPPWPTPENQPINEGEARRLTALLAPHYREFVLQCCRPIFWFPRNAPYSGVLSSGSITLLQTPTTLLGITAAHVLHAMREADGEYQIRAQIGDAVVDDWEDRIIAVSDRLDLATIRLDERLIKRIGTNVYPLTSWPPLVPEEGRGILIVGFPGNTRSQTGQRDLSFGPFMAMGVARSVSDHQITWASEPEFTIHDPIVKTMPSHYELGGISGGAVIAIFETPNFICHHRLCGIVSQANAMLDNIVAKRADCVLPDGRILETLY